MSFRVCTCRSLYGHHFSNFKHIFTDSWLISNSFEALLKEVYGLLWNNFIIFPCVSAEVAVFSLFQMTSQTLSVSINILSHFLILAQVGAFKFFQNFYHIFLYENNAFCPFIPCRTFDPFINCTIRHKYQLKYELILI